MHSVINALERWLLGGFCIIISDHIHCAKTKFHYNLQHIAKQSPKLIGRGEGESSAPAPLIFPCLNQTFCIGQNKSNFWLVLHYICIL